MKINFKKHLDTQSLLDWVVITGLTRAIESKEEISKIVQTPEYKKDTILDITLSVNGVELDVEAVCDEWQKQISDDTSKRIKKYVKSNIENRISTTKDLLDELERKLQVECDGRLEDWEKQNGKSV